MSKKLESILSTVPPATAHGEKNNSSPKFSEPATNRGEEKEELKMTRVVASIPVSVKNEIRKRVENTKGETETTIVLKALKAIGFTIKDEWLIDKRSKR